MRVVCVRLPEDVYEILARRAVEEGYRTISDYLRSILVRVAYGIELSRLEELERRVRRLEADVTMLRSWITRLLEEHGKSEEGDKE